jgi:small subunit ribosomal protein S6|tara:strand:+ start:131 stop:475 length:345 start_codon:yes stop_codon:yes gene_type:complete
MNFYEQTLVAKQDLNAKDLDLVKDKYSDIIKNNSGEVIKIEDWGLLNFAKKIKNYNKGHFFHYKFKGDSKTLQELDKTIKLDRQVLRNLLVKYKALNLDVEYFSKEYKKNEEKK